MLKSLNLILSSILIISLFNCGGGPTKEQKEWVAFLNDEGYFAKVVKGLDECIETAEWYLKLP